MQEVKENSVLIHTPKEIIELKNDVVLAMTGYQPNFALLENIGIELSTDGLKTPSYNPETMETNIDGLFLAGVVCGGLQTNIWFIENSRIHAEQIINSIKNKSC